MKFLQKTRDVIMTFLTDGQSGSVVLYFLQSSYLFRGNAGQKRIAIVNSRKDTHQQHFVYHCFPLFLRPPKKNWQKERVLLVFRAVTSSS